MVFSSSIFLVLFLPLVLVAYYLPLRKGVNPSGRRKNLVLLIASVLFYAWGEPVFVFVMLLLVVVNWMFGLQIDRQRKNAKIYLVIGVGVDLSILFIYKYLSFVSENVAKVINNNSLVVNIALPIGISFFTFQVMSYLFDVYYGKVCVQKNLVSLVLYVSFFSQLIAGPIVRYADIEKSLGERQESKECVAAGFERFAIGLGKKFYWPII